MMNILAFEDTNFEALEIALSMLFPQSTFNINSTYSQIPLHHWEYDLAITDMMMTTDQVTSRRKECCGVPVLLHCKENDIPAVCLSSNGNCEAHTNFASHILCKVDLEFVGNVDKTTPEGWIDGLKKSFRTNLQHWTVKPSTAVRSNIQEWHEGLVS